MPPELEAYAEERVHAGTFASASELITEAVRRKMESDAWLEQEVLEAEQTELSLLTREDLESVRSLIRRAHALQAS